VRVLCTPKECMEEKQRSAHATDYRRSRLFQCNSPNHSKRTPGTAMNERLLLGLDTLEASLAPCARPLDTEASERAHLVLHMSCAHLHARRATALLPPASPPVVLLQAHPRARILQTASHQFQARKRCAALTDELLQLPNYRLAHICVTPDMIYLPRHRRSCLGQPRSKDLCLGGLRPERRAGSPGRRVSCPRGREVQRPAASRPGRIPGGRPALWPHPASPSGRWPR